MGGLNHFIPLREIMVNNNNNILTSKNNLSLFFRKIPDKFVTSEIIYNINEIFNENYPQADECGDILNNIFKFGLFGLK